MLWHLLLAHFLADYPLQSTWMARNKIHLWVLILHVLTHFVTMVVVTLPVSAQVWPYLLALAAIHFGIDTCKNWFTIHRPQWRTGPYLIDQALHIISIGLVSAWIPASGVSSTPLLPRPAAVVLVGFLLVTEVYMISERVLLGNRSPYLRGMNAQAWTRLVTRAALLGLVLLGWNIGSDAAGSLALVMPYPSGRSGLRFLITDLLVTLLTALLVILVLRSFG